MQRVRLIGRHLPPLLVHLYYGRNYEDRPRERRRGQHGRRAIYSSFCLLIGPVERRTRGTMKSITSPTRRRGAVKAAPEANRCRYLSAAFRVNRTVNFCARKKALASILNL